MDKNALICDLAEVYNIHDYTRVPVSHLGILATGLGENSRIGRKHNKVRGSDDTIMLARIVDCLEHIIWSFSEDGRNGINHPKSIASEYFTAFDKYKEKQVPMDDFDDRWEEITGG